MINARKILRETKNLSQRDRIKLHSGRAPWMLDLVTDDCDNLPRAVLWECVRLYINQGCSRGYKNFALWLHECWEGGSVTTQARLGHMIDAMNPHRVSEIREDVVIAMLRMAPRQGDIDVEQLILDLDDIYDLETQSQLDYPDTVIDRWTSIIACGKSALYKKSQLTQADGECTGYEDRTITYAAAQALQSVGGMHYLNGEHVQGGMIKVAVDTRYLTDDFSGNYEKITAPYADCKNWNNQNPPERWIQFTSYDEQTGLCEAVKPVECPMNTNPAYNAAYVSKRQQKQRGRRDIVPPVIDVADLNMEVPTCMLN